MFIDRYFFAQGSKAWAQTIRIKTQWGKASFGPQDSSNWPPGRAMRWAGVPAPRKP
jgi:hypothetical protein